ncbi:hypothetical protein LXA43DRAFT_50652 [Ganoderma leucocontextum]|nr:hypothetical protein LXA43DRAFT_50652 [Ganoderma leucocontextum]
MAHSSESTDIRQVNDDWTLPFDVMSIVMATSHRSTISALMKSCRVLYSEGPKYLLCDGVELGSTHRIVPFANFMLTEDPSRFAHLRTLDLSLRLYLGCLAQARLTDILSHPSLVLETLILRHGELLLEGARVAPLREAFGRLKTIKHLVVRGVREESASMIKSLPSKLESISIGVYDIDESDVDLLSMLEPFSNTLHTLLLKSVPYIPAPVSAVESPGPCAFPHVRTFGVVCHDPGAVTALLASPVFARAFPTITDLELVPTDPPTPLHQSALHRPWQLDRAIRLRERNRVQRLRYGDSAFPALSSLRECSGRLFDVYALALGHTLSTLRLWQDVGTGDFPMLRAVLEDTCPECLCLGTETANDVERLSATLRTLQHQTPPRIDLNMSVAVSSWCYPLKRKFLQERFRSLLEPLLQPPPPGLVELNVFFTITDPAESFREQPMIDDALGEVEHWVGIAVPSLTFTCDIDEDWEWPDLGQEDDEDVDDMDAAYDVEKEYDYDSDPV